ncbi:farnesyl cysteine-carboxyl methyltransferase [Kickxella alabastrina]|uniref:Farnesyl cysteine-carboxyl methyltransferase n=1 Tax=Kickxella alabastrina TaxID=61397 RepID=A0ACC1IJH7_9FUNG|nr:farnesyl cysteine-carboxyl methyltransferase [Kickxella alabastrina]
MEYETHSGHNIALTACGLGIVLGCGLTVALNSGWTYTGIFGIYSMLVPLYHVLEYMCVALYNPSRVELESFMFSPDGEGLYPVALAVSLAEYVIECWLFAGGGKTPGVIPAIGLVFAVAGQLIRTLAMITAKTSFNHYIANRREQDHTLITHGIYKYERHPSYVGFFMWAVGLQLMLKNPLSTVLFAGALSYFFCKRVAYEERTLRFLFGEKYTLYMEQTSTLIPILQVFAKPKTVSARTSSSEASPSTKK